MKIKWWGHACFLVTASDGTTVLTDPYNKEVPYSRIIDKADLVTVSHDHFDHNAVDLLPGNPEVLRDTVEKEIKGITIRGVESYHDSEKGSKRGANIIFLIEIDNIKICHLGDLGHPLDSDHLDKIGEVDILLIPVGGHFTIDAKKAFKISQQLQPSVIIPMHYKTDILDFPIKGVENFLKYFDSNQVKKFSRSELEIEELTAGSMVYVLNYVK